MEKGILSRRKELFSLIPMENPHTIYDTGVRIMKTENNLSHLREQRGMTQKEVAEELGITRQAISQWESGRAFPSMEKQLALSQIYGVSVEALYRRETAENTEKEPEPPAEEELPGDAAENERKEQTRRHPRKRLWAMIFPVSFFGGVLLWGGLTNSKATAIMFSVFVGAIILVCWLLCISAKLFVKLHKKG